jgi:hypothetical protein
MSEPIPFAVIVPVLNQHWAIARSVESVIAQAYEGPITVIVMDGGSTDGTLSALERAAWRDGGGVATRQGTPERTVCWWSSPDVGPQDAIRKGIAHLPANGIIGVQCSSDEYTPGAFGHVARYWRARPKLAYLAGQANVIAGDAREVQTTGTGRVTWRTVRTFPLRGVWRVGWIQSGFMRPEVLRTVADEWPPVQTCHTSWLCHYLCRALRDGYTARVVRHVWSNFYRHGGNYTALSTYWEDRARTWAGLRARYPELTPWWKRVAKA